MSKKRPAGAFFWGSAAAVFALDQATKWVVFKGPVNSREYEVLPGVFFRLDCSTNVGIAWGLFQRWPQAVLLAGVIAAVAVVYYYYRYGRKSLAEATALGMVLGGAAANLADRAFIGQVRDFLAFRAGDFRWPTFNAADTFITAGAVLLTIAFLRAGRGVAPPANAKTGHK